MKRILGIAFGLALSTAAYAADMPTAYEPPPTHPWHDLASPTPLVNWTGFYLGAQAGGGWGSFHDDFGGGTTTDGDFSGGLLGGVVGYNMAVGNWIWGAETDIAWANLNGSALSPNPAYSEVNKVNWFGTTRLRIGVPTNNLLWYAAGGLAYGNVHRGDTGPYTPGSVSQNSTKVGWTIGAGAEMALQSGWSLRGEYLYVDLGSASFRRRPAASRTTAATCTSASSGPS